jgi:hypothetical protein
VGTIECKSSQMRKREDPILASSVSCCPFEVLPLSESTPHVVLLVELGYQLSIVLPPPQSALPLVSPQLRLQNPQSKTTTVHLRDRECTYIFPVLSHAPNCGVKIPGFAYPGHSGEVNLRRTGTSSPPRPGNNSGKPYT